MSKNRKRFLVAESPECSSAEIEEIELDMGTFYMQGEIHIKLTNVKTGKVEKEHSFRNLITNTGLNLLGEMSGSSNFLLTDLGTMYLALGSGSTPPTVSDIELEGEFARKYRRNWQQNYAAVSGSGNTQYWYGYIWNFTFLENEGNGEIREFGLHPTAHSQFLWARALYKDESGSVSSFAKTTEQQLDVEYRFRYYTPTGSWSGAVVINAVTYSYTGSVLNVDNAELWTNNTYFGINSGFLRTFGRWSGAPLNTYPSASVLIHPTGSGRDFNQGVTALDRFGGENSVYPYEVNSFERKIRYTINPAFANYGGIPGIGVYYCWVGDHNVIDTAGHTQFIFDPPLPKTDVDRLYLVTKARWSQSVEINE